MRKYLQVAVVLVFFGFLVLIKQLHSDEVPPVVNTPEASAPALTPTPTTVAETTAPAAAGQYTDGTYTGDVTDASYGNVQVQAIIASGRISDVKFLQYPSDNRTSRSINGQAMPPLIAEALQAQNAQVDTISGASDTSEAFRESLASALSQAKR